MHNGRILHIEDDPSIQRVIEDQLGESDAHEVVETAETMPEALESLEKIQTGELDANVIVVDGNLTPGVHDGRDAQRVIKRVRKLGLPVRVIGYAAENLKDRGIPMDAFIQKGSVFPIGTLAEMLDEMPEPVQTDVPTNIAKPTETSAPDPERDYTITDAEKPLLEVGFPMFLSKEALVEATPDLSLEKYEGKEGLLGRVVDTAIKLRGAIDSPDRQEALRQALTPLVEALEKDNKLINRAAGRNQDGLGSLRLAAVDIDKEAAPYWMGDGPLTVPITKWPGIQYTFDREVSVEEFLIKRPDVASRIRVYADFVL